MTKTITGREPYQVSVILLGVVTHTEGRIDVPGTYPHTYVRSPNGPTPSLNSVTDNTTRKRHTIRE